MEQESPCPDVFRGKNHLVQVCGSTVCCQGIMQPHVIFPHNGNGVRLNLGGKSTHIKFTFPQEVSGKHMEHIGKSRNVRIFNMIDLR